MPFRVGLASIDREGKAEIVPTIESTADHIRVTLKLRSMVVYLFDDLLEYFRPLGSFGVGSAALCGADESRFEIVRRKEVEHILKLAPGADLVLEELPESLRASFKLLGDGGRPVLFPFYSSSGLTSLILALADETSPAHSQGDENRVRDDLVLASGSLNSLVSLVALSRATATLTLLDQISTALIAGVGVSEAIKLAVNGVGELFGSGEVRYVSRSSFDDEATTLVASSRSSMERRRLRTVNEGVSGYVFTHGIPGLVGDLNAMEFWPKSPRMDEFFSNPELSARSSMAAPIVDEMGRVVAVIGATHDLPGVFSRDDLKVLESLCQKLSSVLNREELFSVYRRRVSELELVRRLSIGTSGTRSYLRLAREIGEILRSELSIVGGYLAVAADVDRSVPVLHPLFEGETELSEPEYVPGLGFTWSHGDPLSIISGGETIGYLFARMNDGPVAGSDWMRLMQTISHQLGAALANVIAYNTSLSAAEEAGTAAARAHREAEKIRAITDTVRDVIIVFSAQGKVEFVTPSVAEITGFLPSEVIDMGIRVIEPSSRKKVFAELRRLIDEFHLDTESLESNHSIEIEVYSASGSLVLLEVKLSILHGTLGEVEGFVGSGRDVSARKELEESLRYSAYHDPLTGLPNRRMIEQRLTEALAKRQDTVAQVAILFVDLDGFKRINDSMGHEAGDQVLLEVTERILACVRPYDTVGRLGGDEFVVLLEGVTDRTLPAAIARRITESLEANIYISERQLLISASIGVAVSSPSTIDASELLRRADAAMYGAKRSGGSISVGEQDLHLPSDSSLVLAPELLLALERSELELHFQPIIQIRTGEIVGYEGLLRWYHRSLGWVSPSDFVPAGEAAGLAGALARVVLNDAISMIRRLRSIGSEAWVSINYSPRQFVPKRLEELFTVLSVAGPEVADRLVIEITETSALYWDDDVARWALKLGTLGVRLALDDFGSGFSSLSNLRDLPVQIVKVDRKFVQGAPSTRMDGAIVGAVLMMARSKGASIIGEGVETVDQLSLLKTMGVDMAQGYLISRAKSIRDILIFHEAIDGVWRDVRVPTAL